MSEMHGSKPYPDANTTLRFTYGEVKGYVPHDAAVYQSFTHLAGVIEKDTGREPFDVPSKLKDLFRAKDFGSYSDGPGRARRLSFDHRHYRRQFRFADSERPRRTGRHRVRRKLRGLGNDFFYNDPKGRTISVDIRYVLFVTDKFGGAGYILKELDIKNPPRPCEKRHKFNLFSRKAKNLFLTAENAIR
jgi:hypothetical protein